MRISPLTRLAALAAAALLAAGCAGAPRAAAPAAPSPPAATAQPAAAQPADNVQPARQAAYPEPAASGAAPQAEVPIFRYRVVNSYPHDHTAWTQGLVYIGNDTFYEGTGLEKRSELREVTLTNEVRRRVPIDPAHFGEGVAVVGERIFQLTWQNCVGYIYDRATFEQVGSFAMPTDPRDGLCVEGWGLTYDGSRLILSDGTERLYFVDPAATEQSGQLAVTGQVSVTSAGVPIYQLNELEYIKGEVYANIWQTESIARIDPASGRVTGFIDLSGLRAGLPPPSDPNTTPPEVLNGIAYDAENDRLFVTGKLWPLLFEIDLVGAFSWIVYLPVAERA